MRVNRTLRLRWGAIGGLLQRPMPRRSFAAPARAEYFVLRSGHGCTSAATNCSTANTVCRWKAASPSCRPKTSWRSNRKTYSFPAPPVTAAKAPFRDLIESAAARYSVDAGSDHQRHRGGIQFQSRRRFRGAMRAG